MESVELILKTFDHPDQAKQLFEVLKASEKSNKFKLIDAAILIKDRNGKTRILETRDVDSKHGALFGASVGALIGLIAGPAGLVLGAVAGAATGGVAAKKVDMGFSNEFLEQIRKCLHPDNSAILLIVEDKFAGLVVNNLDSKPGKLYRHAIESELASELLKQQKSD